MSELWVFPWEREAIQGSPMPEGLPLADQMAYAALRNIYQFYRAGVLSREQGAKEKRTLRQEYEKAAKDMAFADKLNRKHYQVLKGAELLKAACRKDPSPENALRLCDVLDGLKIMEGLE